MDKECYLVVSDIHGSDSGIELVEKAIAYFKPISVLSAGDQCPNYNHHLYSNMISVRGNCDSYYSYDSLPFPPQYRTLNLFGRNTVMTHGDRYFYQDFDLGIGSIFIFGHSHVPHLENRNGIYLVNPGSPSRPRSSSGATAALIFPFGARIISLLDFRYIDALDFS